MFDQIFKVAFVVEDVAEAVRFHTEVLDFRVDARFPSSAGRGEDFVFLRSATAYVELLPKAAMGDAPLGFHHIALLVDSVDERIVELKQRGGVTGEPFEGGVGGIRLADVEGPEGIRYRLFTSGRHRRAAPPAAEVGRIATSGRPLEKLAGGFQFTEGPVWHPADNCLYFSDIPASKTYRYDPGSGATVVRAPNGKSNGMALDHDGGLVVCQHAERRLVKRDAEGNEHVLADRFAGRRFNSPNDVVVKSDGTVYFTDPPYGLTAEFGELGETELGFYGVFHLVPDQGEATCVVDELERPNGLCFSLDESILYVNDSAAQIVMAYRVEPDGSLSDGRLFAEIVGPGDGVPDGMKVDRSGNVWVTGPGGIWVLDCEGSEIGRIETPELAANFCFGGPDDLTLYVTASTSLYGMRLGPAWR